MSVIIVIFFLFFLPVVNTQISILLLCFLYLFVELMITMNEYIWFKTRGTGGDRDSRRWGKRETIPNVHWHHRNDSCIKMSSCRSYLIFFINCARTVTHYSVHKKPNQTELFLLTSPRCYRRPSRLSHIKYAMYIISY